MVKTRPHMSYFVDSIKGKALLNELDPNRKKITRIKSRTELR